MRRFHAPAYRELPAVSVDQETGIAFASKKVMLPLKVRANPYGFIGKFQVLRAGEKLEQTRWKIVHNLAPKPAFGEAVKNGVISAFVASRSYDEVNRLALELAKLEPFSSA